MAFLRRTLKTPIAPSSSPSIHRHAISLLLLCHPRTRVIEFDSRFRLLGFCFWSSVFVFGFRFFKTQMFLLLLPRFADMFFLSFCCVIRAYASPKMLLGFGYLGFCFWSSVFVFGFRFFLKTQMPLLLLPRFAATLFFSLSF